MFAPQQAFRGWSGSPNLLNPRHIAEGRLSLTAGTDLTTSDVTSASAIVYTQHTGNLISLPTPSGEWVVARLPKTPSGVHEISKSFLASSPWALTSATAYDIFAFLGANGPDLELGPAWSSASARATAGALARYDGAWVLGVNPTRRYLGTIYASGTNICEDSLLRRYVWNAHNRFPRPMLATDATVTWNYNTNTWRRANGSSTNGADQLQYVVGLSLEPLEAFVMSFIFATGTTTGTAANVGIGLDSSTVNSAIAHGSSSIGTNGNQINIQCAYRGWPGIGYTALNWLEIGAGTVGVTTTWVGTTGGTVPRVAGIYGTVFG